MKAKLKPRCFFDIDIGHSPAGRVVFELYDDICPKTAENFVKLCTGECGTATKKLHYIGSPFHRVIKGFMIQGGDFTNGDGSGGESIYGGYFEDESFSLPHDKPFLLSMANCGPNSNGSQFFITTKPTPHLNGKHVVFGHVVSGENLIESIENLPVNENSKPIVEATIKNCGDLVPVLRKKAKKVKEQTAESDSSKGKKKRKKKLKKKNKKKLKTKKTDIDDINPQCSVRPDEVPEVPKPYFLYRGNLKKEEENKNNDKENAKNEEILTETQSIERKVDKSGRTTKGRGKIRYQPSPKERSLTPPHWHKEANSNKRILQKHKKSSFQSSEEEYPRQKIRRHEKQKNSLMHENDLDNSYETGYRRGSVKQKSIVNYEDIEKEDFKHLSNDESGDKNNEKKYKQINNKNDSDSNKLGNIIFPYGDESEEENNKKDIKSAILEVEKEVTKNQNDNIQNNEKKHKKRMSSPIERRRSSSQARQHRHGNFSRFPRSRSNTPEKTLRRTTKSPPAHMVERWKSRRQQIRGRRSPFTRQNELVPYSSHPTFIHSHRKISRHSSSPKRRQHSKHSKDVKRSTDTADSSPSSTGSSAVNNSNNQPCTKEKSQSIGQTKEGNPPEKQHKEPILVLKPQKTWVQNQWKTEEPEEETVNLSILEKLKEEVKKQKETEKQIVKNSDSTAVTTDLIALPPDPPQASPPISQSISKFRSPSGTRSPVGSKNQNSRSSSSSSSRSKKNSSSSSGSSSSRSKSRSNRDKRGRHVHSIHDALRYRDRSSRSIEAGHQKYRYSGRNQRTHRRGAGGRSRSRSYHRCRRTRSYGSRSDSRTRRRSSSGSYSRSRSGGRKASRRYRRRSTSRSRS